jgi:hypothetical protein
VAPDIFEAGVIPLLLGGDDALLWPDPATGVGLRGPGNVGAVYTDTHVVCANDVLDLLVGRGTSIRIYIEDVPGKT